MHYLQHAGVGDKDTKAAFAYFDTFYGLEAGNEVTARILDEKSTRRNYKDDCAKSTIDEVDIITVSKTGLKSDIEGSELKLRGEMRCLKLLLLN